MNFKHHNILAILYLFFPHQHLQHAAVGSLDDTATDTSTSSSTSGSGTYVTKCKSTNLLNTEVSLLVGYPERERFTLPPYPEDPYDPIRLLCSPQESLGWLSIIRDPNSGIMALSLEPNILKRKETAESETNEILSELEQHGTFITAPEPNTQLKPTTEILFYAPKDQNSGSMIFSSTARLPWADSEDVTVKLFRNFRAGNIWADLKLQALVFVDVHQVIPEDSTLHQSQGDAAPDTPSRFSIYSQEDHRNPVDLVV